MGKITEIKKKVPLEATLPDGIYSGVWGGYVIEVNLNGEIYQLTTEQGVRGVNIKVVVIIKDGIATFESIKNKKLFSP
ncbi:MAG: hypothetical protein V4616_04855 [Bacteroidota bacterium]